MGGALAFLPEGGVAAAFAGDLLLPGEADGLGAPFMNIGASCKGVAVVPCSNGV